MDTATLTQLIRKGIREPSVRKVSAAMVTQVIADAINIFGLILYGQAPEYFTKRVSVASTEGNIIFNFPTGLKSIRRIWDMDTNAGTITGTSASGTLVNVLQVAHGFATGDTVTIHDIVGTTEANGTWIITKVDVDNYTLDESVYANAWVSGGTAFKEEEDFDVIDRIPDTEATGANEDPYKYYLRGTKIIIDDLDFENDIILLYRYIASTLAEIPAEFHFGLVSYGVITLMELPNDTDPKFRDYINSYNIHKSSWQLALDQCRAFAPSVESDNLSQVSGVNQWI